jgi:transcriptional regulator with XRE-family HTH domain
VAREELARFLRERRNRLRPQEPGLRPAPGPRRRTPGLRREEIAESAHISVDYYIRMEQARGPRPSAPILDALAGALRLSSAERSHLFRLAGVVPAPPASPARLVRPHVAELINRLPETAAVVTAANYDVLCFNPLAEAILGGLAERPNLARRRILERDQVLTDGHEDFAALVVSRLRTARSVYPEDAGLSELVTELAAGSEEFRGLWAGSPVRLPGHRTKNMSHPELGSLRINCDVLVIPEDDQQIVFMTADPGTPTARALRHLAFRGDRERPGRPDLTDVTETTF